MENKRSESKTNGLVAKVAATAGAMGAFAAANYAGKAEGETIVIYNSTTNPSINGSLIVLDNNNGDDLPYSPGAQLEIYSNDGNPLNPLFWNSHPQNTTGWDFELSANSIDNLTVTSNLRLEFIDKTGLEGKTLYLHDNQGNSSLIPVDSFQNESPEATFYTQSLVNQPNGEYAQWRLDIVPEPSTGLMAAIGIGAVMAGAYLAKKFSRR